MNLGGHSSAHNRQSLGIMKVKSGGEGPERVCEDRRGVPGSDSGWLLGQRWNGRPGDLSEKGWG